MFADLVDPNKMASKINALVAATINEARLTTLDNLQAFLATKEDVDMDFMQKLITEFKATLAHVDVATKKAKEQPTRKKTDVATKKRPSAYNLFMKYAMTERMECDTDRPKGQLRMKAAMALWADISVASKIRMNELYRTNPKMTGKELFEKSKVA